MTRRTFLQLVGLLFGTGSLATAQRAVTAQQFGSGEVATLSANAEREARRILSQELYGHYDIVSLRVLNVEGVGRRLGRDYGLAKVTLEFSTRRNDTRSSSLNPSAFEREGCVPAKVPAWFYLHCGVPTGHIFGGKMEILLTIESPARWTAVSPNWRTLQSYPLQGYLLLEGKQKEGYVLFPIQKQR
jgi:hypothetical protein